METRPPDVAAAFEELGLPLDTPPERLRRAYLGVVKKRPPEKDPEGFKRAREAFDLLSSWFAFAERAKAAQEPPPAVAQSPVEAPAPVLLPQPTWTGVRDLFLAHQDREAFSLAATLFDRDEGPVHPEAVLLGLISAQTRSPGAEARRAVKAAVAWARRTKSELVFLREPQRWLLVQDFATLPAAVPPEVEAIMAGFLLDGDLEGALARTVDYTRAHGNRADAAILPLSDASPLLHGIFARALNPAVIAAQDDSPPVSPPPPVDVGGRSSGPPIWIGLFVLATVLRLLFGMSKLGNEAKPRSLPPPPISVAGSTGPVERLCIVAPIDCYLARRAEDRAKQGDCEAARMSLEILERRELDQMAGPAAAVVPGALSELRGIVARCLPRATP